MHTITRKSLLIAFITIIAFTLAACSSGNNNKSNEMTPPANDEPKNNDTKEPEAEPPVKKDPVELTVGSFGSESEKKSVEDWFVVYQKTHPHVTLKYITLEGDPASTAMSMAASGNMPDVVWLSDGHVRTFYEQGIAAPLNDAFERMGVDLNDVNPAMISYGAIDGNYYFAPRDLSHMIVFVNKTLLEQEGIPMPTDGWTWDQFVDIVKQVTKKNEVGETIQYGVDFQFNWLPNYIAFAQAAGGDYLNRETMKLQFSDPKVIEGLSMYSDLIKEGYAFNPFTPSPNSFAEGKVAFLYGVRPHANSVNDWSKAINFQWDLVTLPRTPVKYAVGSGTSGYAANAKSKHLEEATDFVASLLTPEAHKAFGLAGNAVPLLKSLTEDPYWRNIPETGKNDDAYVAHPESDVGRDTDILLPAEAGWKIVGLLNDAFTKYLNGQSSLEDALKVVDEQVNALIK
ncbi:ABC transporter substrate-binding protein [Paenibacillus mendelii]|uniref:ABC transporter substrate-binding protein n=1 Tax=Paenibacillus mendelii TaxID=206163 RepID=A0ABV6JEZ9_9BACL|nr:sugar ABC transporter substrate-binding protein [Paenibacillus mendelii]MCQ6557248.1 sugar ABC transporter substrate-binding protein [Paenibacillus mendelii]